MLLLQLLRLKIMTSKLLSVSLLFFTNSLTLQCDNIILRHRSPIHSHNFSIKKLKKSLKNNICTTRHCSSIFSSFPHVMSHVCTWSHVFSRFVLTCSPRKPSSTWRPQRQSWWHGRSSSQVRSCRSQRRVRRRQFRWCPSGGRGPQAQWRLCPAKTQ